MDVRPVRLPPWLFPAVVVTLTLLPIVEMGLLIVVGGKLGVAPTLLLCASTGFAGAWLARWQGLRTALEAQRSLAEGRFPGREILHGALLLVGGVVLLTPGLVTDVAGLLLLVPPVRRLLVRMLRRWWTRRQGIVDGTVVDP